MKASTLLACSILSIGLTACFDSSTSSPSQPSNLNDVKGTGLTTDDRAFLSKLASSADAFTAISKSGMQSANSTGGLSGAARRMAGSQTCASPEIIHDIFWELGDSSSPDSIAGGRKIILDDTTTRYDLSGKDITCDPMATLSGYTEVFRQAMREGDLLTTSMGGTTVNHTTGDISNIQGMTWDMSAYLKGVVSYTNGFTLELDTGYLRASGNYDYDHPAFGIDDAFYHVNFRGYPYSSGMRYDKASEALVGDVVRGTDRIGVMKLFQNDSLAVLDLDGNLIRP